MRVITVILWWVEKKSRKITPSMWVLCACMWVRKNLARKESLCSDSKPSLYPVSHIVEVWCQFVCLLIHGLYRGSIKRDGFPATSNLEQRNDISITTTICSHAMLMMIRRCYGLQVCIEAVGEHALRWSLQWWRNEDALLCWELLYLRLTERWMDI